MNLEVFMMKKVKNTDILFIVVLSVGFLMHIYFAFSAPFFDDESFYSVVPFRLVNGDSLVQHEWHLTQFSSLFAYLPVYVWTVIKGSADGIFAFMRITYLVIHTAIAVVIYRFFRKYEKWAVMASMMFYIQVPYKILAISYQSMFVVFLLLLTLCLVSIYEKASNLFYVFAGVCFGCCCVCNPLFCFVFPLYLVGFVLWAKRQTLRDKIVKAKASHSVDKDKKLTKKQKREQEKQLTKVSPELDNYNCFFSKKAVIYFSCGLLITVIVAIIFFFATGGTIRSIQNNIENLLSSTEYDIASNSIFSKLQETCIYFFKANLGMPFILPILFIVLVCDKNRKNNNRRFGYLTATLVWSIIFIISISIGNDFALCAVSLPFSVLSTICYLLTENRNKVLFRCMCIPCFIAVFFQYLAANTHLAAIGVVLTVGNVAGVIFAMDLWKEIRFALKERTEENDKKTFSGMCCNLIVIGICVQIVFYGAFNLIGQTYTGNDKKVTSGPFSGLHMSEDAYDSYNKRLSDMDVIRELSRDDEPVLLVTYNNWMHLYLDRPVAVYTTWYRGAINQDLLTEYYRKNPKKIPKYIYVDSLDHNSGGIKIASEMFVFTEEELSKGILLTVEDRKF